jgi:alkylation response protein AidB-like acyl-CoA dehydrogenase
MAGLERVAVDEDGVAVWHARTVPELADAVRYLAGRLSEVEPAPPPDLSGYVPLADFQALQAQVATIEADLAGLQGEVANLDDRVAALEAAGTPVP